MTLTDKEIVARYEAGESQVAIARIDKRGQNNIRRILLRNDVRLRDARQEQTRGGQIAGQIAVESGHFARVREAWSRTSEAREANARGGRISGRVNVESGQLARNAKGVPSTADGILFRSQTEAAFYCVTQELGGEPIYEPTVIPLSNGRSYTPDFIFGRSILGIPANVPIELKPARNATFYQKNLPKAIEAGAFVVYWDELVEEI